MITVLRFNLLIVLPYYDFIISRDAAIHWLVCKYYSNSDKLDSQLSWKFLQDQTFSLIPKSIKYFVETMTISY